MQKVVEKGKTLYDNLVELEESIYKAAGQYTDWLTRTKFYAQEMAAIANGQAYIQNAVDAMNPFVHVDLFNVDEQVRRMDKLEQDMVERWGVLALDAAKVAAGASPCVIANHLKLWHEAINVPYPIAQLKYKVVHREGIAELREYEPLEGYPVLYKEPALFVFAPMNREKVWDLDAKRNNSVIQDTLRKGYRVFVISWGDPGPREGHWSFETYVEMLAKFVKVMQARNGGYKPYHIVCWCLGGTITLMFAALFPDTGLRAIVPATTPLDFSDPDIIFRQWIEPLDVPAIGRAHGHTIPKGMVQSGALSLHFFDATFASYSRLWKMLGDPKFVDAVMDWRALHTWLFDPINMSEAFYTQLRRLYLYNELVKGQFKTKWGCVDFSKITASIYFIVAGRDHIALPSQTKNAYKLFTGTEDKVLMVYEKAGHISVLGVAKVAKDVIPALLNWLVARSTPVA